MLAGQQTVVAGRAAVDRAGVLSQVIGALAKNELRPGADASRARAEVALAQTQLIQAEQAVDVAKAALAQLLGIAPAGIQLTPGPLLRAPPELPARPDAPAQHPFAMAETRAIEQVKAREKALDDDEADRIAADLRTTIAEGAKP